MRFYIDTEFYSDGDTIDLASIALVSKTGAEFYRESDNFRPWRVSAWVKENVLPLLGKVASTPRTTIAYDLVRFVEHYRRDESDMPEFWGDCCAFDFVALSQLLGDFNSWPSGWPFFMHDIKQLEAFTGIPAPHFDSSHHALEDAKDIKRQHEYILSVLEQERLVSPVPVSPVPL